MFYLKLKNSIDKFLEAHKSTKEHFQSFGFSWIFITLCGLFLFGFFLEIKKEEMFYAYFLFFSIIFIVLSPFIIDFMNEKIANIYLFVVFSIVLSGFTSFIILTRTFDVPVAIFWNMSLLLTLIVMPFQLFFQSVFFGMFGGCSLFFILDFPYHHEFKDMMFIFIQTSLFFIVWIFLYSEREKRMVLQEEILKESSSIVNHEIKTYLSAIEMSVLSLKKDMNIANNPIIRIQSALRRIIVFLELFQGNFREEYPKKNLSPYSVRLFIEEVMLEYCFFKNEKQLVSLEGEDFKVFIDKNVFKHVLFNLIKNAIFFIKKAQKGKIKIILQQEYDKDIIIFEDTGYGIKEEYMRDIFKKFYSRRRKGTGMGLYFCKKALEHYDATITCESVFMEYTRFLIVFSRNKN